MNLTLKGSVTTRGKYDDNIFLTPNNEIEDFITTVSPGLAGQYKLNQNNFFDLLYGGDFIFHKKSTHFVKDEVRHNLKASLNLNPMEYIYLNYGFYSLNSFKQIERDDKLLGGSLNFIIYFSKYLSLILAGNYNRNNFSSKFQYRVNKTFSGSSSIEFQPCDWFKFGTRFQTEKRDSNNLNEDYKVKRYLFYGTIFF